MVEMNKNKVARYCFRGICGVILLAAWVLILHGSQGFTQNPAGYLVSVVAWGILAGVPAALLLLTAGEILSEKISPYWLIPAGAGAAVWTDFGSSMLGAVGAICPFDVWQKERLFFWYWFLTEYEGRSDGDLAAAAERMMSPGMIGDIQQGIEFILLKYQVLARLGSSVGIGALVLTAVLYLIFRRKKNAVRFCCAGMLTGLLLLGIGSYNWTFARKTRYRLNTIARQQQECMKAMRNIRPAVSREEIIKMIEAHARKEGWGEGSQSLLERIEGKKR